jgi:hypothetical protein
MTHSNDRPGVTAPLSTDPQRQRILFEALIVLMGREGLVRFIKAMREFESQEKSVNCCGAKEKEL